MQTTTRIPSGNPSRPFGTGYGRSSSYGTPRSYASSSVPSRFRIA